MHPPVFRVPRVFDLLLEPDGRHVEQHLQPRGHPVLGAQVAVAAPTMPGRPRAAIAGLVYLKADTLCKGISGFVKERTM